MVGPGYLAGRGIAAGDGRVETLQRQGKTVVFLLLEDDRPVGAIALADIIRPESGEAVRRLKAMGVRCMMLTGDNHDVAAWVAGELDLDEFFAGVLPHEKAEKIREVQRRYRVAMVGDGLQRRRHHARCRRADRRRDLPHPGRRGGADERKHRDRRDQRPAAPGIGTVPVPPPG